VLRQVLLAGADSSAIRRFVERSALTRRVVRRFVAGSAVGDAVAVVRALQGAGLASSLDHLGEDTTDSRQAAAATQAYLVLLDMLGKAGLAGSAEASLKLSALGALLDPELGVANARVVAAAASAAGTTVTLDMEDSSATEATLGALAVLRRDYPQTGGVIQAYLRRSEADCRTLAASGARVRLCKGAYAEPPAVAFASRAEVDASYARCLQVLMSGPGYPMVATHDPALIRLAGELARQNGRSAADFEFQMLYGIRPDEQRRLAAAGYRVRVYVPYGDDWYGYLMRRLAERPANLGFFLRALAGGWRGSPVPA
jgi:proline dehydrogenase